ncbi:MAG: hypothetical protein EOP02_08270 [Proteobacteria bacterium]|nr:MAG: hypothetical protein EOP02_08270 [Pseudomonadota bacterium]
MDDEDYDTLNRTSLVRLLVLEAGRLMEDASFDCALNLPRQASERRATLERLEGASTAMQAILQAALVVDGLNKPEGS